MWVRGGRVEEGSHMPAKKPYWFSVGHSSMNPLDEGGLWRRHLVLESWNPFPCSDPSLAALRLSRDAGATVGSATRATYLGFLHWRRASPYERDGGGVRPRDSRPRPTPYSTGNPGCSARSAGHTDGCSEADHGRCTGGVLCGAPEPRGRASAYVPAFGTGASVPAGLTCLCAPSV